MARKKASSAARNRKEEIVPNPKSRKLAGDLLPPPPGEFENLKALNQLLLKETMERREQVSHLNSLVEDLSDDHLILSTIECEILSSVVAVSAAEKVEIQTDFDEVVSLKDGILLDLDSKTKEVEDLRTANSEVRSALERVEKERADDCEVMKAEREADAGKLLTLEEKYQSVVIELSGSRDETDSLKKKEEKCQSQVAELGERNAKMLAELVRVRAEFGMLKAEKEEGKARFEDQMKESKKKLDEFEAMMAEITVLNDGIERARAMQEVEIARLQNEAELKQCTVSELERVCKDHTNTNARLLADIDARRRELDLEREETEGLRSQVGNLEKNKDGLKEELERLHIDFTHLKEEKEEGELQFEDRMKETLQLLDDLRTKMGDIGAQRDEIDRARADQEAKNAELQNEVDKLQCSLWELERVCKAQADANALLQADIETARGDLNLQREEAEGLRSQVGELEKSKHGLKEELERLLLDLALLKKAKEEGETCLEDRLKEITQCLVDSRGEMVEISAQREEIERARADQEAKNAELQKELDKLQCSLSELERVNKAQAEEVEGLRSQVGELEKSKHGLKEELERLLVDLALLKKAKEEGETCLEDRLKEITQCLVDSRGEMVEISAQREEIERARADQEAKNAELQKELDKLQCSLSELERVHKAQADANALLQADIEAARGDLKLEREEATGLKSQVGELEKSKHGLKEELERLLLDLALLKKAKEEGETCLEDRLKEITQCLVDSRGEMVEISAQREEIERARADQVAKNAELQKELDKLQCSLSELERVHKAQADANALLQADIEAARGDLEFEREEATGLKYQVGELKKSKDGLKEEFERLLLDLALVKKEKEEDETRLEDRLKETTQYLVDLKKEVVEISAQRDEIDRARADHEYQKVELQRDVDQLQSTVSELERVCKGHVEAIAVLQVDKDAACRNPGLEKGVAEGLRVQLSELQRSNDKAKEELEGIHMYLSLLEKEKNELEKHKGELESNSESQARVLHDLRAMMGETRAQHEADITELQKATSQLEGVCRDHETVLRGLDALRLQVAELEKTNHAISKDIRRLKAEDEEHKAQIRLLAEEKASLDTRLAEAQHELEGATRKMKNVEMNSEKALSLLKSIVGFMLDSEREVMVRDLAENGDEMQPFASELEAIRMAFVSKTGRIEDLSSEAGILRRKKKGVFWAWICPAITTAALAAISLAYATKGN